MASTSQSSTHHHQSDNNAHNLAMVASAAGYTTDNQLAGLVEAATAAAGQDVGGWSQAEEGDANMNATAAAAAAAAGHSRGAPQNHLDGYPVGVNMEDEFGNGANGSQAQHFASGGDPPESRKRKRANPNVDPAMTSTPLSSQFGGVAGDGGGDHDMVGSSGGPGNGSSGNANGAGDELRIRQVDVRQFTPQQAISDARAAGVHSAVALFRQPSSTSKKHTRPPMSKMFASLELSPENFLHLQAAAKGYMLDDDHPERRDCVGQRGKGDMEMVKLRLWNCVRDFLEREGNGLRFFGADVVNEGMGPRTMIWPRDDQKIISLVMPLLRRMVTNERQRQYAIETRKGGSTDAKKRKEHQGSESLSHATPEQSYQHASLFNPDLEPSLSDLLMEGYPTDPESLARQYSLYNNDYQLDNLGSISGLHDKEWCGLVSVIDCHYQIEHGGDPAACDESCEECLVSHVVASDSFSHWRIGGDDDAAARNYFANGITRDVSRIIRQSLVRQQQQQPSQSAINDSPYHQTQLPSTSGMPQPVPEQLPITIRVSVLQTGQNNKRLLPRLDIPADQCPDFQTLLGKVRQYYQHHYQQQPPPTLRLRAWLEDGLMTLQGDGEWMMALLAVSTAEWMDGELRIVADGESQET